MNLHKLLTIFCLLTFLITSHAHANTCEDVYARKIDIAKDTPLFTRDTKVRGAVVLTHAGIISGAIVAANVSLAVGAIATGGFVLVPAALVSLRPAIIKRMHISSMQKMIKLIRQSTEYVYTQTEPGKVLVKTFEKYYKNTNHVTLEEFAQKIVDSNLSLDLCKNVSSYGNLKEKLRNKRDFFIQ